MTEPVISTDRSVLAPTRLGEVIPGGLDAVATIYDDVHADLYGYAASLTHDTDAAADLVHEAFTRLVQEISRGRPVENPRAWLYRVCTNLAFSRSRRRATVERWIQSVAHREPHDEVHEGAEETVIRRERQRELQRALDTLPKDHRAALLLAADGFDGREIAGILGRSEGATRNLLWRARTALKDRVEPGGGG